MNGLLLIKYGELTTKKGNRKFFIQTLEKNIRSILKKFNFEIEYDYVRMYIKCEERDLEEIVSSLQKVFGIHGIVICHKANTKDEIFEIALKLLKESGAKTFKVETVRADKSFPIPSMEFSRQLGGYLLKNLEVKVDVHHPDEIIKVEIRREGNFVYVKETPGIGGYPVGIQGKGILMLSGGIDSPVAGYLALKRGVDVECLYFESPPHTSVEAKNKVITLASILNEYSGHIKVHVIPFTKLQEEIYKKVDPEYVITIMRRMMYRIAEKVAHERKAKIIINGESIGQVASQTLSSMSVINAVTNMPVIRPVACMDKLEIISLAEKIGTYTTSILPYEDCCTIFLPKHPVIHPNLERVLNFEKNFDFESLVDECVRNKETITSFENDEFEDLL
ncbi:MAG TPA: tRNA 4-thiouridine(8) synthase ThiI [Candidatus Pelethosoma merdigallinarum]|nr:tRNA 4-thiouridine(8) synthase ThiI [Candidatus Pelethosoma merdigallinarum]